MKRSGVTMWRLRSSRILRHLATLQAKDDCLVPGRRNAVTGAYHEDSELLVTHKDEFISVFNLCLPLFNAAAADKILVLSSLPRY